MEIKFVVTSLFSDQKDRRFKATWYGNKAVLRYVAFGKLVNLLDGPLFWSCFRW